MGLAPLYYAKVNSSPHVSKHSSRVNTRFSSTTLQPARWLKKRTALMLFLQCQLPSRTSRALSPVSFRAATPGPPGAWGPHSQASPVIIPPHGTPCKGSQLPLAPGVCLYKDAAGA